MRRLRNLKAWWRLLLGLLIFVLAALDARGISRWRR